MKALDTLTESKNICRKESVIKKFHSKPVLGGLQKKLHEFKHFIFIDCQRRHM